MDDFQQRADFVTHLLAITRIERYFYLVICAASAIILIGAAAYRILQPGAMDHPTLIVAFWGSGGVITISTSQILRVWTTAMRLVLPTGGGGANGH
jgi:hypothetical protein